MSPKMKIILGVIAVIALVYIAACIYNSIFPKKYLKDKYPNAEIVSSETRSGGFNLFAQSDYGYRYFKCSLYDRSEDIHFIQDFWLVWYFPFYRPKAPAYSFEEQLAYKTLLNNTIDDMKAITEKYTNECTVVPNPFDDRLSSSGCGCYIFVNRLDVKDLADLTAELDGYILQKWRQQGVFCYITYSVSICMDGKLYGKFAETDFSKAHSAYKGHAYFTDMLTAAPEFEAKRITASNNGFSSGIYKNHGDPADGEYQDPNGFDHLVFWYSSEPNAMGHQHFYLFGVNEKE